MLTSVVFFFDDTATIAIYTLSLHDALPICGATWRRCARPAPRCTRSARSGSCSPASASTCSTRAPPTNARSEEHTSELQSRRDLVCRLLLEKKNIQKVPAYNDQIYTSIRFA